MERSLLRWLRNWTIVRLARIRRWLGMLRHKGDAVREEPRRFRASNIRNVVHCEEQTRYPSWKACHPRTRRRFKAEMVCSNGHPLVLSDHRIDADGTVAPSVVCRSPGCGFHEFVRLAGWQGGELP